MAQPVASTSRLPTPRPAPHASVPLPSTPPPPTTPDAARSLPASPTPPTSPRRLPLALPDLTYLLTKLRRSSAGSTPPSPPPLASSSGPYALTHKALRDTDPAARADAVLAHRTLFTCEHAVDARRLLAFVRQRLLQRARDGGADALVDEQWTCTIRTLKPNTYRVQVDYSARPVRSGVPDAGKVVALGRAEGVRGVMNILDREEYEEA